MKKCALLMSFVLSFVCYTSAQAWFPADQATVESLDALVSQHEQSDNGPEDIAGWQALGKTYITDLEKLAGTARADLLCIMKDSKADALQADFLVAEAELAKLEKTLDAAMKTNRPDAPLAQGDLKASTLKLRVQLYITTMRSLPAHPGCSQ